MKTKILACVMAMLLLLGGALAEGATLTVQGAGMVEVKADCATICLGVREVAVEVQDAQAAVNEKIAPVIEALVDAGIDRKDIATNAINIYPNYDYSTEIETIASYSASNSLLVTTSDMDNLGKYIDAAFAAGANTLDYVDFTVAETSEAGRQALEMAIRNAMEKATVIADAAGKRVGAILEIKEGPSDEYSLPTMYAKAEDAGAGTQVIASGQSVTATVTVVLELMDAE